MSKDGKVNIGKVMGKRGSLHKALGIPEGQKIGKARLAKAAKGGGKNAAKANLAMTLNGYRSK